MMSTKPPVKSSELSLASVPAFWPMAMAASLLEASAELYARDLKFVEEEIKIHGELRPALATPNRVRLDLRTMLLRDKVHRAGFRSSSTPLTRVIPP
jgi:hypothetical protein